MSNSPTILITGGTGFAGSHLVEALLAHNQTNIHVTSYGSDPGFVAKLLPNDHLHSINLTDFQQTKQLLEKIKPDQVYHLAALAGVANSFDKLKQVLDINTQIQLSVLLAVREVCPKTRILSIGSALEYQPQDQPLKETDPLGPISPYGVSKVTQDMLAYAFYRQDNLQIIRTRSFNHIGERQTQGFVVPDFALQIVQLESNPNDLQEMSVGNLSASRDFTDVKDVVQAYATLMDKGQPGEVYNIGSGKGYTIKEILDILINLSQMPIKVKKDQNKYRPIDVPQVVANIDKIKELGWQPSISIENTLKRTLDYYRA